MVYSGPISTCCHECRRRKVKCDGIKPECDRCTRRGTKCTGFPEQFKIINSQGRKYRKATSRPLGEDTIHTNAKKHTPRQEDAPSRRADGNEPFNSASEHRKISKCDQKKLSGQEDLQSSQSWPHGTKTPLVPPFYPAEFLPNQIHSSDYRPSSACDYIHRFDSAHTHTDRHASFEMLLNLNEHQTSLDTGLSSPEEETDTCFNELHGRMGYGPIFGSCNPSTFEWTDIGGQAGPSRPYPLCEDLHEAEDARLAACYDPLSSDLQAGDFISLSQSQVSRHPYLNHTPTEEPPNAYHVHELSPQSHPPLDLYMSSFFV